MKWHVLEVVAFVFSAGAAFAWFFLFEPVVSFPVFVVAAVMYAVALRKLVGTAGSVKSVGMYKNNMGLIIVIPILCVLLPHGAFTGGGVLAVIAIFIAIRSIRFAGGHPVPRKPREFTLMKDF